VIPQRQMSQARATSEIDVKIKGLQAVKAFKDAIGPVRPQLHDLADQAASVSVSPARRRSPGPGSDGPRAAPRRQ